MTNKSDIYTNFQEKRKNITLPFKYIQSTLLKIKSPQSLHSTALKKNYAYFFKGLDAAKTGPLTV